MSLKNKLRAELSKEMVSDSGSSSEDELIAKVVRKPVVVLKKKESDSEEKGEKSEKKGEKKEKMPREQVVVVSESESEPSLPPSPKEKKEKKVSSPTKKELRLVVDEKEMELAEKVMWEDDGEKHYKGESRITTERLKELFGDWREIDWEGNEENKDKRYMYEIVVGKKVFVVYDKIDEDDEWDDEDNIEWFVNGDGALKTVESVIMGPKTPKKSK